MKKTLALLLCVVLAACLFAACGQKDAGTTDKPDAADKPNTDDKTPADDVADGIGDAAQGAANAANDVWDGLMKLFGADAPTTDEGTPEVFARDYGIDEDLLDSYTLRVPRKENDAAEFFIAKVKEGKMSQVEEKLEARKKAIADKWKDNTDESMAYAKEPVILKNGNYIMLAVHADMDEAKAEFERLTKDK